MNERVHLTSVQDLSYYVVSLTLAALLRQDETACASLTSLVLANCSM